jgi:DNA-binding CsgD family transcriptional regulator
MLHGNDHAAQSHLASLSPREIEVLSLAASGLTNTQIADRIGVTIHGVKFHLMSIYRKLGVRNRTEAATIYARLSPGAV